ncbi:mRNA interferase [Chromobacterium piscinae]|nr:mRNA interferase [Chromobacterium piscinae]
MKQSEFVRWLIAQGVEIKNGSKHLKLYHNGEQTILPRHPSAELKQPLVEGVKKKLKLK